MKQRQMQASQPAATAESSKADTEGAQNDAKPEMPKVTFDDYEKLMERLEKEQNFDEIQKNNPKAMEYMKQE